MTALTGELLFHRASRTEALRTPAGRLALVAPFTAMLAALKMPYWWAVGITLALTSLFPAHRKRIALVAAACWVLLAPAVNVAVLADLAKDHSADAWIAAVAAHGAMIIPCAAVGMAFLMAWAFLWFVRRFSKSPIARRPVMWLILLLLAMYQMASAPLRGLPWLMLAATTVAFNQYIWFFAYWIIENCGRSNEKPLLRMYALRPFWGFTTVPYGKGPAYLEQVEAQDAEQLAMAQLKGIKLLILAAMWTAVLIMLKRVLFGPSDSLTSIPRTAANPLIPTYQMALDAMEQGHPYSLPLRWAALIGYFTMWVLYFTIFGHKVVAICRMSGFNIFRNTYKPYLATSIAEFFNCIYYYFKELLVIFFFYPTYLRYFKRHPRLRLLTATFGAAGLGNFLFHFLKEDARILRFGLWNTLLFYRPYMMYTLVLGCAISLSQLRHRRHDSSSLTGARRVAATAGVWLFFCLLCVIEEPNDRHGLASYGHYFASLFVP